MMLVQLCQHGKIAIFFVFFLEFQQKVATKFFC